MPSNEAELRRLSFPPPPPRQRRAESPSSEQLAANHDSCKATPTTEVVARPAGVRDELDALHEQQMLHQIYQALEEAILSPKPRASSPPATGAD